MRESGQFGCVPGEKGGQKVVMPHSDYTKRFFPRGGQGGTQREKGEGERDRERERGRKIERERSGMWRQQGRRGERHLTWH